MNEELWSIVIWPLIGAIATGIAGFIGIQVKALYQKYVNDKTKQDVVKTCVMAAEQIYHHLGGPEKLKKAQEAAVEMLNEKGIPITQLELDMLCESVVAEFNYGVNGKKNVTISEGGEENVYTENETCG